MRNVTNIFTIFKRDIKNIFTNWVALVVVIALIVLPALYAWFNIKAMWDPYGNTSEILVAVVNEDKGSSIDDTKVNIGSELVTQLKANDKIGWRFVNYKDADTGVKNGKYYASIVIPQNFSSRILSLLESNPKKAELIYSVNEKLNPVAPKITQSGIDKVQQEINTSFVKIVDGIIFKLFNKLGEELTRGKPFLQQFADVIIDVDNKIPEINRAVDEVYTQTQNLNNFISSVNSQIPLIEDTMTSASDMARSGSSFLSKAKNAIKELSPFIKSEIVTLSDVSEGSEDFINNIISIIDKNPSEARNLLGSLRDRYSDVSERLSSLIDLLNSFNKSGNTIISNFSGQLNELRTRVNSQIDYTNSLIDSIDAGKAISSTMLNTLKENNLPITSSFKSILETYDSLIAPSIEGIMQNSIDAANNTLELLNSVKESIPVSQDLLKSAQGGSEVALNDIKNVKDALPEIESTIHDIATKLKSLNENDQVAELVRLMSLNAQKESDFIANPVNVKMNRIYPIPNYGSAMNPFFTTLSLWVGGLILASLLSTEVLPIRRVKIKLYQAFLGRYLTFLTIAILQAIVVTLGDIFMLHVYVLNPIMFVAFSAFISTVFSMIIYTLVSVFGNVGKAIAMVLLVLQISASGGTFPVQVTPEFFQIINPILPFTYAVSGVREIVSGILWNVLLKDVIVLLIYFTFFLIMGLIWKRLFRNLTGKFTKKFKESGLEG
jgi:putative membrane protein